MKAEIRDNGRGPEIDGTRITVYDILDYRGEHSTEWIAEFLTVTVEQVEAAYAFIDANHDEVMKEFAKMLARDDAGNSPEIRAKMAESRKKIAALRPELERKYGEIVHA